MLFDLRGRRRRRTVQVVYASLAILMGGGLVLFGIGGDVQGGLFDAFREDSQGGGQVDERIENDIERAERAVRANPRNPRARATLARLHFQAASVAGQDDVTGEFDDDGKARLREAARAWERYLALEPEDPDENVASLMVQAYLPTGINDLDQAVRAQEIVTEERDSPRLAREQRSNLFGQLAQIAYLAGQTRKGDLAADRAVELEEETGRRLLRQQLDQVKEQAAQQRAAEAQRQGGGAATAPQGGAATPQGGATTPRGTSTAP